MNVKLIWITPNAEQMISDIARVSNPDNQGLQPGKLLGYCVRNKHWSPFEMANAVIEIETTRDIARQILRHRSFSFQEFSQRYADVNVLERVPAREARLQDDKNRQNSIENTNTTLSDWWIDEQNKLLDYSLTIYNEGLKRGLAKEVSRSVLPEGLTSSRMYMNGTIRSWMHYCQLRSGNGTQKEHQEIAIGISTILKEQLPLSWEYLHEFQ